MKRWVMLLVGVVLGAALAPSIPVHQFEAAAAPLRITLNCEANGGLCDSANPCLDGITNCTNTNGAAWDHTALGAAMAVVASQYVGTATSIDLSDFCTGPNCASATYHLRVAVPTWSVVGTDLLNDGDTAGSSATDGPLQVQVCFASQCDTDSFNWLYQTSVNDTTAPPIPVGLTQTSGAAGTATLEFQTVAELAGTAAATGIARYSIRNATTNAEIATLNAAGPGLLLSLAEYAIGSPPGTNTCTQSGLTVTMQSASSGYESSDQGQFCGAPVTGDFTAVATATSLPYSSDWSKLGFEARESDGVLAADAQCYFMVSSYGWHLQGGFRTVTGNDYRTNNGTVQISNAPTPSALPLKIMLRRHGDLWDCAWSSNGQVWTYAYQDRAVTLPGTLLVGTLLTPTSLGTQISGQMQQVSISNTGRVSKVLTLSAATSVAVRAIDGANNASANSVAITLSPGTPAQAGQKKWNPGYYMKCCLDNNSTGYRGNPANGQATRFAMMDTFGTFGPNVKGVMMPKKWVELEPTQGDYATGIALLRADIDRAKANGLHYEFFFMDEPNYSWCNSQACHLNFFPQYLVDAGCVESHESVNYPGQWVAYFKYYIASCAQYYVNLLQAYGAAFDTEPALETVQLDYEQALELDLAPGFTRSGYMSGVETIMQAAAAAFPHTNLVWEANWGITYVGADVAELLGYAKANLIGWADQDACDMDPDTGDAIYGTFPKYIDSDNIFAGWGGYDTDHAAGQYTDQRGKMMSGFGVENSELGYNSVCRSPGFVGYAAEGSALRTQGYMSLYHNWESLWADHPQLHYSYWIGIPEQQWAQGVTGSLWDLATNHPMTHVDCPTDYDDVLGDSSPGSGCNTTGTVATEHKWHPGHYVRATIHHLSCATDCDATRHSLYEQMGLGVNANIKGTEIWINWKWLESDSGNNFIDGFNWLHNELNYVKQHYPGKQVGLLLNFAPYGWTWEERYNVFPAYLVDAGCVYDENSAETGGGSTSLNWFKNNATCRNYFKRLIAAYGAEFDSDQTLEWVRNQQETDDASNAQGVPGTDQDSGWKDIMLAMAQAFPSTMVEYPINWVGVETAANKEALLNYMKGIQVAMGNGDTQPICHAGSFELCPDTHGAFPCPSTAWACVVRGLNASIGGTNHNNCGEFVSAGTVELSEMGYNSVIDPWGGLTSKGVVDSWNEDTCQQYGLWDANFGYIGTEDTQWFYGAHGQLWAINGCDGTCVLQYTTKPAGYR